MVPFSSCTWIKNQVKSGRVTVFPPEHGEMQAGMHFFAREFSAVDLLPMSIRQILDYVLYWAKEALFLRCQNTWNKKPTVEDEDGLLLWLANVGEAFHLHLDWQRQEFSTWSDEINLRRSCLNGTNVSRGLLCDKTIR